MTYELWNRDTTCCTKCSKVNYTFVFITAIYWKFCLNSGIVQRFDSSVLAPFLPPKYEYVLYLKLSDLQRKLYEQYLSEGSNFDCNHNRPGLLADFHELERICTHPKALTDTRIADNEENDETEAPIQRRCSTWWSRLVRDEDMSRMEHSAKITLLVDILRRCKMSGEKVLVFSQFLHTLNLILAGEDERNRTIPENNEVSLVSSNQ